MARMAFALRLDEQTGRKLTGIEGVATALWHDKVTDTLYAASGTSAIALFTAPTRKTATWMGRIETMAAQGGFAWMQVNSRYVDADGSPTPVTVRLYGDDDGTNTQTRKLVDEFELMNLEPVRMPDYNGIEFIVEIETKARVESINFASTTADLKDVA